MIPSSISASLFELFQGPVPLVCAFSIVIGFLMVIVFRFISDQKAIGRAKDQLKAHMLAVRLFQDQLPVVVHAYGQIIAATSRYLRLTFKPFLIAILPVTLMMIFVDRYLGWIPLHVAEPFVVEAQIDDPAAFEEVTLQLPSELAASAPAVHIPKEKKVAWRVTAAQEGKYEILLSAAGKAVSKEVVISRKMVRVSPVRWRGNLWERIFTSGESALPEGGPVQSISVAYAAREIGFAWMEWNWIVLFFVLSLIAGFVFKTVLGIQI